MSAEPVPEQVYADAAYAHLRAVKDPADVDWYVTTQAAMPGHRAAVESRVPGRLPARPRRRGGRPVIRRWLKRRRCFHRDNHSGESWIGRGSIIDWRKYYSCSHCGKAWIR